MLLPSAHAGSVVEVVPESCWGNVVQDLLSDEGSGRMDLFRHRILPSSTAPAELASVTLALVRGAAGAKRRFGRKWTDHEIVSSDPHSLVDEIG
jgi:hypothetical protein